MFNRPTVPKIYTAYAETPTGSVVVHSTIQLLPKIYISNVDSVTNVTKAILAMQKERKLEQRDLDEEKSLTGLENKEKCRNATELPRGHGSL